LFLKGTAFIFSLMRLGLGKFTASGQIAFKLPTTITLLCSSVAANVDIYFCVAAQTATKAISTCFIEC
jgi:hypothetical protein